MPSGNFLSSFLMKFMYEKKREIEIKQELRASATHSVQPHTSLSVLCARDTKNFQVVN